MDSKKKDKKTDEMTLIRRILQDAQKVRAKELLLLSILSKKMEIAMKASAGLMTSEEVEAALVQLRTEERRGLQNGHAPQDETPQG